MTGNSLNSSSKSTLKPQAEDSHDTNKMFQYEKSLFDREIPSSSASGLELHDTKENDTLKVAQQI
jgi:hypothetical protein